MATKYSDDMLVDKGEKFDRDEPKQAAVSPLSEMPQVYQQLFSQYNGQLEDFMKKFPLAHK